VLSAMLSDSILSDNITETDKIMLSDDMLSDNIMLSDNMLSDNIMLTDNMLSYIFLTSHTQNFPVGTVLKISLSLCCISERQDTVKETRNILY
jgi:hypothetical protein